MIRKGVGPVTVDEDKKMYRGRYAVLRKRNEDTVMNCGN